MKVKLALLFVSLVTFLAVSYFDQKPTTIFKPNVRLGTIDLSGKSWPEGTALINGIFTKPVYLNTQNTSRAVTFPEIGISLNRDRLFRYTRVCRVITPPLFCKNTSNEPVIADELLAVNFAKLDAYLDSLETELAYIKNNNIINFDDYSFRTLSPDAVIKIDRSPFADRAAIAKVINEERIKIDLAVETEDDFDLQHTETQALIDKITTPLLIKYGGTPIYVPKEQMAAFIYTQEINGLMHGFISASRIETYLKELMPKYESDDVKLLLTDAVTAVRRAILYRAADEQVNQAVILPIEGLPRTNGELHDAYLEVVKPQQRLYRFEHGKLVKTYIVSTGLTWDTPAGAYKVLGKQKMTISYFGNWYMPYYLPIGKIFNTYQFGFHAIPYHMDAAGNIYSRDENTMGSPATGGCIQLRYEEAKELFEWAKIGIPVYVYD